MPDVNSNYRRYLMGKRNNGEGTFVTLGPNKIVHKICIGKNSNGKPKFLSVTGTTKADCKRKMKARLDTLNKSQNDINNIYKDTLTSLCKKHLASDISHKHMLKPKAADRRESTINNQIAKYIIGSLQVQSITSKDFEDHIEVLINENHLSVSSIKKTLDVINSAFEWAISQKILFENPCTPVMKKLRKRLSDLETIEADDADVIVLSDEEEQKLIAVKYIFNQNNGKHKYPNIFYVLILLYTGIRLGELCCLRWGDFHRSTNTLTINKTRYVAKNRIDITEEGYRAEEGKVKNVKSREIVLSDKAKQILDELYELKNHPSDNEYILTNHFGKPSNPTKVDNCIKTIYKAAGLSSDISGAHILRRTCATRFYEQEPDIDWIASYLGDTPETVSKYYIAIRKKISEGGKTKNVVPLPRKRNNGVIALN